MKKTLILEPYFGGSHKNFLEGLMRNVKADYTVITLPARKWKMRMQLSAQWFVEQIGKLSYEKRKYDTVLCSTFVDVAVFRALISKLDGWCCSAKICLYFHENQFAYPNRIQDTSLYHFTSINFNSALSADTIAFNSNFNRTSFVEGCARYLKFASDMKFENVLHEIENKSCVISPGIEFSSIDVKTHNETHAGPVIVWNHRWEHDKNPDLFFKGLQSLKKKNIDFKLIVLGQSFRQSPECFAKAENLFKDEILHFGFVDSYGQYVEQLKRGTIVVSTSDHEFYGISILEAVRAGCRPLLPNRLSYPELFPEEYLYNDGAFFGQLGTVVQENRQMTKELCVELTDKFSWQELTARYDTWLFS
jgi:glycosyltransferase involved in cell wall biosynthesis